MSTILRPDILIESPSAGPIAIVEVRNRQNLAPHIAADMYQALNSYGYTVHAPFFLIVSQDTGYLWRQPAHTGQMSAAAMPFDMQPVIARYLPNWPLDRRLDGPGLKLVVGYWLNELAAGFGNAEYEPEYTLAAAGLLAAMRDARITQDPAQ